MACERSVDRCPGRFQVSDFAEQNPSSELLARFVFLRMKDLLSPYPVRLTEVMFSEKASSRAYYSEGPA